MRHVALVALLSSAVTGAAPVPKASLEEQFGSTIQPFVKKYCVGCHSGKNPAAQFDLSSYNSVEMVAHDYPRWALVKERLHLQDMPPKPMPAPPSEAVQKVSEWIQGVRAAEIKRSAGDPGPVPARRLNTAEYNYTVRDLTGQDMHVTREFPIDPANPAGFDNSGESLTMSPALLNKYLQAAREVANHVVLTPSDIEFAPHPMLVETDREKYTIPRIVNFYLRQPTKYSDYFRGAWQYKYRVALGKPRATLASTAADLKISPKYLPMVWQILNEPNAIGPVLKLQTMWQALPAPGAKTPEQLTGKFVAMEDFVTKIRAHTAMQFSVPKVKGLPAGSQPLLNWKLKEFASSRRMSDPNALRNDTDPQPAVVKIPKYAGLHQDAAPRWAALMANARIDDTDLIVPAADRARYEAAFSRFANVFPDRFYVSERGRYFPDDSEDKGRLLGAGYHNVMGFYRDDTPLMELILDDAGKKELDRLWNEFDLIARFTERTWVQFFFNQSGAVDGKGAESGTPRPLDHAITDPEVIFGMRDKYLAKAAANPANDPIAPRAIHEHFEGINATLRGLERQRKESEPKHLDAVLNFAARAYRRPLTNAEREDLLSYYRTLRSSKELSHEDAIRELIASVLMAPDYLYRFDLQSSAPSPGAKSASAIATEPLSPYELASRLSYFLWSSMPDDELLKHAAAGDLQQRTVLLTQMRRMLKDPRSVGLATEFTGNWLSFRHFEKSNSVDRQRFPEFNNDLRAAMFEEPVHLVGDVIANNRSVLDLLYGEATFVNPVLAKHYGMPEVKGGNDTWVRVDDASKYGRGGLLPMAVFLTQNSPGLRTSPVKRGNWVVQRVLGEVVPPPPPTVPELPHDESTTDLPVRDLLAKHRENAMCSACHSRIDSFGLAFEGYGPVGNARTKDLAGRTVDTVVAYPGGMSGTGVEGLQAFIRGHRQSEFVANLSRKLFAFALSRSLQLSDEPVVEQMQTRAAASNYRFQTFVETIVTSPQFLNKRIPESRQRVTAGPEYKKKAKS